VLNIVAMAAIAIVVALVAVLAYAASRPDTFRIQRTATMKAPPERIFPFIDDLRAHTSWSPFEKDPDMKRAHSGAARGKGAVYEWEGNRQVGAGRIAIMDSTPAKITMTSAQWRKTRWALRTGENKLTDDKRALVNKIARSNRHIGRAWTLKEQLRDLYRTVDPKFYGDFSRLLHEVVVNYQKRNISILDFLDFYDSYKQNTLQLNSIQFNRVSAFEDINYYTGTNFFN